MADKLTSKFQEAMTRRSVTDLTGKPAIPFSLPDTGGEIHRLEDYRGCWLLLIFLRHLG